jgi:hypothetical protein
VFYDRGVSDRLLDALDIGGVLHPLLTRALRRPGLLDLQLRGYPGKPECWASLYVGLTSVLDVFEHRNWGFRMAVHPTHAERGRFDPIWRKWHSGEELATIWQEVEVYLSQVIPLVDRHHIYPEGRVHAALCSRAIPEFAVVDREASVAFTNNAEKLSVLGRLAGAYRAAIAQARPSGTLPTEPLSLGTGCDLLAVDRRGRLLVMEAKPSSSTRGITWGPVQVGVYADLVRAWATETSRPAQILNRMLQQRVRLGLSPELGVRLREPLDIVPVIAIGGEVRSKIALTRLAEVQRALLANQVGWPNLEIWQVDAGDLDNSVVPALRSADGWQAVSAPRLAGAGMGPDLPGEQLTVSVHEREQVEPPGLPRDTTSASPDPQASRLDLGPQYAGDSAFAARMRRHQSWYRAEVLKVPFGTGPGPQSRTSYGNMLARPDGERGLNFLTPTIFAAVQRRIQNGRGAVEPYRLLHNMLSSQPMCFNLFGPLVEDLDLATTLIGALLPGQVDRVLRVEVEFAPEPASEYLADRTAFDAFVEYRRPDGKPGCLGVETKLSEPFSQHRYDGSAYRRWAQLPDSPWRPEASTLLDGIPHNQLWRDHLLAVAMRCHPRSPYAESHLLLVRHPLDLACARITAAYRTLLRSEDDSFIDLPLDRLLDLWTQIPLPEAHTTWLSDFRWRYLDLAASEGSQAPS